MKPNHSTTTFKIVRLICCFQMIGTLAAAAAPENSETLILPKITATANVPLIKVAEYNMQEERFAATAVISGWNIYIISGQNSQGTVLRSIERFDVETGESTLFANLAVGRLWSRAIVIADKIYVFGGQRPVTRFRRNSQSSGGLPRDDQNRSQARISAASGLGGGESRETNLEGMQPEESVEVIDLNTGATTTIGEMPEPRSEFGCGYVDGLIYIIGGKCLDKKHQVDAYTNRVDIFNPASNTWSVGPYLVEPTTADIAVIEESFIVIPGGYTGSRSSDSVTIFEPKTGKRGTLPPLCRPTSAHATAYLGTHMFLFGDYNHPGEILAYNLRNKSSELFTLQYDAARHAAAVANAKKIFVIGGKPSRDATPLKKIQVFQLPPSRSGAQHSSSHTNTPADPSAK